MAGEIVHMQALHNQNDRAFALVIKTRGEGLLIPIDDTPPRDFRCGVVRLYRIIDNNELPTTPGQRTADGRGQAEAHFVVRTSLSVFLAGSIHVFGKSRLYSFDWTRRRKSLE